MSFVKRHPIITFFVLSYAISWAFLPVESVRFLPSGPLFAALIVIPITQGWSGLKELGLRIIRWRVRWYWYAAAIGVPLAVHLAVVGLNVAAGAGVPSLSFTSLSTFLMVFAVRMVNPADGPLGEHPGWNGVALPGLQGLGYSPLVATMILAPLVRPGEWPRGDDGGDVLVHVAVQPHQRQHSAARHRAQHGRKHPVRARLDRCGRVVGGCDRVGGL
jgi:hypothetical protein